MRRLLFIITILATTLVGCQKEELAEPPMTEVGKEATITFSLQPDQTEVVEMNSRALNPDREKYLRNAEIFCYDTKTERCVWAYTSGTNTLKLNLTEGRWDIYVIGNHEGRLGTMPRSQVENITKTIVSESDLEKYSCLPMRGKVTVNVTGNMRVPIVLTRIVAKVDVTVKVASQVAGKITLCSISLVNAPKTCYYFGQNIPTIGFMGYEERNCISGSKTSFYLFENRQGVNNSITHPKYKSRENAPANGSYLLIKAQTANKALDYYIYLGENTTTDFNVIGNKNYSITVNITGFSETDWRVEVTDPLNIYVTITQADRTSILYWPPNGDWVGSDNSMEVTVNLSQPSQWDLTVPIQGVMFLLDEHAILAEDQSEMLFFFHNARITIPAGAKKATATFYQKLRTSKGQPATLFFNECTITRFITHPQDRNLYTYASGFFTVNNRKSETIAGWPSS